MTDQELIDELNEIEEGLTSWELKFVDDLPNKLRKWGKLTEGQRSMAAQILEERA